ncbi:hypothetical protein PHLCEN_2v11492 [Hermanssonia centrifuga]|uniref:Uncharacterized protein n=1 Tax=Hermanssonia centrifuga TaxID=98765 RepID=A0A2R6NJT7_9APHY|nr:hypothetical protein PHLCEN_2v11492 [Hermanssonia centrifuga]
MYLPSLEVTYNTLREAFIVKKAVLQHLEDLFIGIPALETVWINVINQNWQAGSVEKLWERGSTIAFAATELWPHSISRSIPMRSKENHPRQLAPIMRQLGPIGRIEVLVGLRQSESGTLPIGYIGAK